MSLSLYECFQDPDLSSRLLTRIENLLDKKIRFMEVCGTHTVAIFTSGLRSLLPENLEHVSGPGCPVCVTSPAEIGAFFALAREPKVRLCSYGDMLRVPGPEGKSLKDIQAEGARISLCYSPFEALELARKNPEQEIVFLGVGFETTAPGSAAVLQAAEKSKQKNFSLISCHKLIPPALKALLAGGDLEVDAFILPGHVSTIIGLEPYSFLAEEYRLPAVVSGFEPLDLLASLKLILEQIQAKKARVQNQYKHAVSPKGNQKAQEIMNQVFEPEDTEWRGLGSIKESGLAIRPEFSEFDAVKKFSLKLLPIPEPKGCRCGDVLKGKLSPRQCPLFAKTCTPRNPIGPCMVSTEGSCAAHFKYSI